jgi:hypothetical protein
MSIHSAVYQISPLKDATRKLFGCEKLVIDGVYLLHTENGSELKAEWIGWGIQDIYHYLILQFRIEEIIKLEPGDTHWENGTIAFQFKPGSQWRFELLTEPEPALSGP